jgi:dGTPase
VRFLFDSFSADYSRLPAEHAERARSAARDRDASAAARVVADYVAGMTDRFALQTQEHLQAKS